MLGMKINDLLSFRKFFLCGFPVKASEETNRWRSKGILSLFLRCCAVLCVLNYWHKRGQLAPNQLTT